MTFKILFNLFNVTTNSACIKYLSRVFNFDIDLHSDVKLYDLL